jgi:hypothetical protein
MKAGICRMQGWVDYPHASAGADLSKALKTHKLGVLLLLSGLETTMSTTLTPEWSVVVKWDPEQRYSAAPVAAQHAQTMIAATEKLMMSL